MNHIENPIAAIFAALEPLHTQLPPKTYLTFTVGSAGNCFMNVDVLKTGGGGMCCSAAVEITDSPAAMQLMFANLIQKAHECHKVYQTPSSSSSQPSASPVYSPSSESGSAPASS